MLNDGIDLMRLYTFGDHKQWNKVLSECVHNLDINRLASIRYGIQLGMKNLATQKINTPDIDVFFCRLNNSLEKTAKIIIRIKNPMPGDDPKNPTKSLPAARAAKQRRDDELKEFLKRSSY
jgi:hypothetical protein